jgi:hypothetical protein
MTQLHQACRLTQPKDLFEQARQRRKVSHTKCDK